MREILDRLVAFDTVSSKPNIALMEHVKGLLDGAGIAVMLPARTVRLTPCRAWMAPL